MKNISVIFWTGTGNTSAMADAIAEGAKKAGANVKLISSDNATIEDATNCDALALGCPSMGDEVLEEYSFEPYVASIEDQLQGKPLVLFGSYGWGDGEWMRQWQARMEDKSNLLQDGIICQEYPEEETLNLLEEAGKQLATC